MKRVLITAGGSGIGLAMVGSALGHRTLIVMPENQSKEKIDTLRAFGAERRLIPPVPYRNPDHFVHTSRRLAEASPAETAAKINFMVGFKLS